jgi:hypothetical protein
MLAFLHHLATNNPNCPCRPAEGARNSSEQEMFLLSTFTVAATHPVAVGLPLPNFFSSLVDEATSSLQRDDRTRERNGLKGCEMDCNQLSAPKPLVRGQETSMCHESRVGIYDVAREKLGLVTWLGNVETIHT